MKLANLHDGARAREVSAGHIRGAWRDLGRELDTRTIGLRRITIAAGHFSTPAHEHGAEEEIFYVLDGDGLLWLDGVTFSVAREDVIVHRPKSGAHTLRAGTGGLDVLAFGQRRDGTLTALPRAGVAWSFPRWVVLGDAEHPFAREAAAGPPECPTPQAERPRSVVALADVPPSVGGRARLAGRAAGAVTSGLNHVALGAGEQGAAAHCHSLEEELFVVLDGGGTLQLWEREAREPAEQPLRAGDVVPRPPATGVAHALVPGEDGITYLAYGTREPGDMCFYPQSGRVALRGLGIALSSPQIEHLPNL